MILDTKEKMYSVLPSLGNTVYPYSTHNDFVRNADPNKTYGLRFMTKDKETKYHVPWIDGVHYAATLEPGTWNLTEMQDDDAILFQGEFYRSTGGLYLHYSTMKAPMKVALKNQPRHAVLSAADAILRSCEPWLLELLDQFPDHVIEFSQYAKAVGRLLQPTLLWEVRYY